MYCFPYPRDTDVEPLRAPVTARSQYSVKGQIKFKDFFKKALDTESRDIEAAASAGQISPDFSPATLFASVYQSFLFFGVASEALGRDVRHNEFAAADSIDIRIPSWFWLELKARWKELDSRLTAAEFCAERSRLTKIYEEAMIQLVLIDYLAVSMKDDQLTVTLVSIHMLLYLVSTVIRSDKFAHTVSFTSFASTQFLRRRMIKAGWCEKRLNFLEGSPISFPALYFLSSFKPPRINAQDHSDCSNVRCLATCKLSQPLHRTAQCLCDSVLAPADRVNAIVARGGIPLFRVIRPASGRIELEVVPYTPKTRFVAISHVWSDQQFGSAEEGLPGCQVGYLEDLISCLPINSEHWGWREWLTDWRSPPPGSVMPPSRAYEYFWLDSFCLPQGAEQASLRIKAIGSINFIYATATHTLVFDKGLQAMDAGRRPASLIHGGRSTYFSPHDDELLNLIANIYASNWMGRSWTLQEGILSGSIVFPLHQSMAYLKLLWPYHDDEIGGFSGMWEYLITRIPEDFRRSTRDWVSWKGIPTMEISPHVQEKSEPLRAYVRQELFVHMKKSLRVDEYSDYARTPAARAEKFVQAHSLLQSRTSSKADDIPLILMSMSCINTNAPQFQTIDTRLKRLFYGLESLPTEILFSDCARLGQCTVDAWIPLELTPETFTGKHTLRLDSTGFIFETKADAEPLEFYLLSAAYQSDRFRLLFPDQKEEQERLKYDVQALRGSHTATSTGVWCIVVDESKKRGARFLIDQGSGNNYSLYFDCSLRLTQLDEKSDPISDTKHEDCSAVRIYGDFILKRSHDPDIYSISRPQNPDQYSDRLIVTGDLIIQAINLGKRYLLRAIWGDENSMSILFYIFYALLAFKERQWVESALNGFVHRAWMASFQPGWDPNGPWKWYWKFSNWEPPVPFRTLMKWYCTVMLILCLQIGYWSGVIAITAYWLPLFETRTLVRLYGSAIFTRITFWYFF